MNKFAIVTDSTAVMGKIFTENNVNLYTVPLQILFGDDEVYRDGIDLSSKEFFEKIYPQLKPHFDLKKFPYGALPLPKRAIKWMLNPSIFTKNYLNLEGQNIFRKIKANLDEIRWRILQK